MSRRRERDLPLRKLIEARGESDRFVDYCTDYFQTDPGEEGEYLFSTGGVWDKKLRKFVKREPETSLRIDIHSGQREACDFWQEWFSSRLAGKPLPVYSWLCYGGSRAGKTFLGIRCPVVFAATVPNSRVWVCVESEPAFYECETELDGIIPDEWAEKAGNRYKFYNGSTISMFSANHPHKLKRGRCDFAFLNEGQNVDFLAFNMLRMRTSDTSGLVCVAANPPNDNPKGEWIAEWVEDFKGNRRDNTQVHYFDPRNNPHVNREQLESIRDEVDDRTFRIEVLGEILPPSDAVYHAFSSIENVKNLDPKQDITTSFASNKRFGEKVEYFASLDFQRTPHMAAVIAKITGTLKNPFVHFVEGILVELGDEFDLSKALFDYGCEPANTVLIGDASGDWQDADRTKGGSSFSNLRKCGWTSVLRPDRKSRKNPPVSERFRNDNRMFLSADGERRSFISPEANNLVRAVKTYRRRNGRVDKNAKQSHICDAMGYLHWRLFPPKKTATKFKYETLKKRERRRQMDNF